MPADFGVQRPGPFTGGCRCWALVLQRSTGSMFRDIDNCGNKRRPGKLTCQRHDRFEAEARKKEKAT